MHAPVGANSATDLGTIEGARGRVGGSGQRARIGRNRDGWKRSRALAREGDSDGAVRLEARIDTITERGHEAEDFKVAEVRVRSGLEYEVRRFVEGIVSVGVVRAGAQAGCAHQEIVVGRGGQRWYLHAVDGHSG